MVLLAHGPSPANSKPLRSHSMASKPWVARCALTRANGAIPTEPSTSWRGRRRLSAAEVRSAGERGGVAEGPRFRGSALNLRGAACISRTIFDDHAEAFP